MIKYVVLGFGHVETTLVSFLVLRINKPEYNGISKEHVLRTLATAFFVKFLDDNNILSDISDKNSYNKRQNFLIKKENFRNFIYEKARCDADSFGQDVPGFISFISIKELFGLNKDEILVVESQAEGALADMFCGKDEETLPNLVKKNLILDEFPLIPFDNKFIQNYCVD